ncbi:MAG: hemolysin III family protein [Pseudomonadota bacterium]
MTSLSRIEYWADGVVHALGVAGAITACFVMVVLVPFGRDTALDTAVTVYLFGLVAMIGASAVYNLSSDSAPKALLRRIDHAAIFLMIAGTYTPFCVMVIGGAWGAGLLVAVWTLAVAGAAMRLFDWPRHDGITSAVYLVIGWLILVAVGPLIEAVSPAGLVLLAVGGLLYSVGVVFHLWSGLRFQRAIWHAFVVAAAACHFAAVLVDVVPKA